MKRINLSNITGKLTKEQMKKVMAGSNCGSGSCSGGSACSNYCWCNNGKCI